MACIGAVFNCSPTYKQKRIGFEVWIISNSLLFLWCVRIQAWYPAGMYVLFVGTSSYGLLNHKEKV